MNRADVAFPSMGREARVRLESRSLDAPSLERLAAGTACSADSGRRAQVGVPLTDLLRNRPGCAAGRALSCPR